ncbi:sarcosine oxidase subunit gamma [soil metagenome]
MADTLIRRSPLQGYAARFAALPGSVRLDEEPFIGMIDLWVDPATPGAVAAGKTLGIDGLPRTASTIVTGDDAAVIWLGPDEWLVTSRCRAPETLEAQLRDIVTEHGGAAVDVSAQRTTLRLRGEHAREVLAKGCSLDLHPKVFGAGAAAQTMLGQAAVVLIPLSANGTDFRILVSSSYARHLADWLIDAAEEFGRG